MSKLPAAMNSNRGFTIVEALVAFTILTVGLIPAFLQATTALQFMGQVRNNMIAAHLAQEGVEVVEAIRDTNWFAGSPFDTGLTGCMSGCTLEYNTTVPVAIGGSNPQLKRDATSGLYQYSIGADTGFTRTVTITKPTPEQMKVVSMVNWTDRSVAKSFAVEFYLFNWLE